MNKQELALQYLPDVIPKTAVRHLMRWIAGYSPCRSPSQDRLSELEPLVLLIRSFLGEPTEQEEPSHPSLPLD